jgi:hypothetical protein
VTRLAALTCVRWVALSIALGAVAFVPALACRSIAATPTGSAPRNECGPQTCADFGPRARCERNRCVRDANLDYVLAIQLPEVSLFAPESTFLLTRADVARLTRVSNTCPTGCVVLPQLTQVEGSYSIATDVRDRVGESLTNAGSSVVPSTLRLRPLFALPTAPETLFDAARMGLPVSTIVAERTFFEERIDNVARRAVSYRALVPPLGYEFQIAPDRSFATIPPVSFIRTLPQARDLNVVTAAPQVALVPPFALDRADSRTTRLATAGRPLTGFYAAVVEPDSQRVLSASAPLGPAGATVVFSSVNLGDFGTRGAELWLTPPPSAVAVPTLRWRLLPGVFPDTIVYPSVGFPVAVAGTIGGAAGIGAQVHIRSRRLDTLAGVQREDLFYETDVVTDDAGRFATVLPRGVYTVVLSPLRASDSAARATFELNVTRPVDSLRWNLPNTVTIQGGATTQTGQLLADAAVEFVASGASTAFGARRIALPRPRSAVTNLLGEYVLSVDPGVYDVTVTPALDSGFAPYVVHDFEVQQLPAGVPLRLQTLEFTAPSRLELGLRDPADNLLVPALVRVFVQRPGSNSYLEVGRSQVREDGRVEVFYAGVRGKADLLPDTSLDAGTDTGQVDARQ